MLESSQIQLILALAKSETFSEASVLLGVTQSAVSQSVKILEQKLELSIVSRRAKKMTLTEDGKKLARMAAKLETLYEETLRDVREGQANLSGPLRVGTMSGLAKSWLAEEVIHFSQDHDKLQIELYMDLPDALLDSFDRGLIDVLILPRELAPKGVELISLEHEKATLVFPQGHNINENTKLDELLSYPLITFEPNDFLFVNWIHQFYHKKVKLPPSRLVINSFGQILQAVSKGLGIAVIPTHVFKRSHFRYQTSTLGKNFDVDNSEFMIMMHPEDKKKKRFKSFTEHLIQKSREFAKEDT